MFKIIKVKIIKLISIVFIKIKGVYMPNNEQNIPGKEPKESQASKIVKENIVSARLKISNYDNTWWGWLDKKLNFFSPTFEDKKNKSLSAISEIHAATSEAERDHNDAPIDRVLMRDNLDENIHVNEAREIFADTKRNIRNKSIKMIEAHEPINRLRMYLDNERSNYKTLKLQKDMIEIEFQDVKKHMNEEIQRKFNAQVDADVQERVDKNVRRTLIEFSNHFEKRFVDLGLQSNFEIKIPEEYLCPIGHGLMLDPVILAPSGITYEREMIETWRLTKNTCPVTRRPIRDMVPNFALKDTIDNFRTAFERQLAAEGVIPRHRHFDEIEREMREKEAAEAERRRVEEEREIADEAHRQRVIAEFNELQTRATNSYTTLFAGAPISKDGGQIVINIPSNSNS